MIAFKFSDFDKLLPDLREEMRKRDESGGEAFVLLSAGEYERLRATKIVRLDEAPAELFDAMADQLEEALDRRAAKSTES